MFLRIFIVLVLLIIAGFSNKSTDVQMYFPLLFVGIDFVYVLITRRKYNIDRNFISMAFLIGAIILLAAYGMAYLTYCLFNL